MAINKAKSKQERNYAKTAVTARAELFKSSGSASSERINRIVFIENNASQLLLLFGNDQTIQGMATNLEMSEKRDFTLSNLGQESILFWHIASSIQFINEIEDI